MMPPDSSLAAVTEALARSHRAAINGSPEARSGSIGEEAAYVRAILARAQEAVGSWAHWEAINEKLGSDTISAKALEWFDLAGSAGIGSVRMALARDSILGAFRLTDPDSDNDRLTLCRLASWLDKKDTVERLGGVEWALGLGHKTLLAAGAAKKNAERIERFKSLVLPSWGTKKEKGALPNDPELLKLRVVLKAQRDHLAHALHGEISEVATVDEVRRFLQLTLELATDAAYIWTGSGASAESVQCNAHKQAQNFWCHAFGGPVEKWTDAMEKRRAAEIEP